MTCVCVTEHAASPVWLHTFLQPLYTITKWFEHSQWVVMFAKIYVAQSIKKS